jgi:hypothetical protein
VHQQSDVAAAAGWYPDPLHRYELRWFNGLRWTADVSVDGRRFVDLGEAMPIPPAAPSRTLAILAFIFGLGGLLVAWAPFVFVVAAAAAVTALVLGIVALPRIRRGQEAGRGFAVAGMAAAVAALGLCVVGFMLTRTVVREFDEYMDPGPVDAVVTECSADDGELTIEGTVENLDDRIHDYVVVVRVRDDQRRRTTEYVHVDGVGIGELREWDHHRFLTRFDEATVACDLLGVNGPYPFGLPEP